MDGWMGGGMNEVNAWILTLPMYIMLFNSQTGQP